MTVSDALSTRLPGAAPESVVRPTSTEGVAEVLSWASREGVGVLPLGSGDRLGRAVPEGRYVALSTERLAGIEIYEPADLTLTAGAGTPVRDIDRELRANGQWAPFDPPFVLERTLGGLTATGESGPLWMGYGELRNHVLGATVVTGDGRVVRLGGRVVKNVAGYDLLKPIVGSRGSLGVITSVCLRAFPLPTVDRALVLRADHPAELVDSARAVGTAPIMPVSSVLVHRAEALGAAALVVRLHGQGATVDSDQATLEGHLGRDFEVVTFHGAPGADESVLAGLGEHASRSPYVVEATARLSVLDDLMRVLESLGQGRMFVDTYGVRARVGLDGFDREAVASATEAIDRIGGAMRVVRAPPEAETAEWWSRPTRDEVDLITSLRSRFDPAGVFWPAWR